MNLRRNTRANAKEATPVYKGNNSSLGSGIFNLSIDICTPPESPIIGKRQTKLSISCRKTLVETSVFNPLDASNNVPRSPFGCLSNSTNIAISNRSLKNDETSYVQCSNLEDKENATVKKKLDKPSKGLRRLDAKTNLKMDVIKSPSIQKPSRLTRNSKVLNPSAIINTIDDKNKSPNLNNTPSVLLQNTAARRSKRNLTSQTNSVNQLKETLKKNVSQGIVVKKEVITELPNTPKANKAIKSQSKIAMPDNTDEKNEIKKKTINRQVSSLNLRTRKSKINPSCNEDQKSSAILSGLVQNNKPKKSLSAKNNSNEVSFCDSSQNCGKTNGLTRSVSFSNASNGKNQKKSRSTELQPNQSPEPTLKRSSSRKCVLTKKESSINNKKSIEASSNVLKCSKKSIKSKSNKLSEENLEKSSQKGNSKVSQIYKTPIKRSKSSKELSTTKSDSKKNYLKQNKITKKDTTSINKKIKSVSKDKKIIKNESNKNNCIWNKLLSTASPVSKKDDIFEFACLPEDNVQSKKSKKRTKPISKKKGSVKSSFKSKFMVTDPNFHKNTQGPSKFFTNQMETKIQLNKQKLESLKSSQDDVIETCNEEEYSMDMDNHCDDDYLSTDIGVSIDNHYDNYTSFDNTANSKYIKNSALIIPTPNNNGRVIKVTSTPHPNDTEENPVDVKTDINKCFGFDEPVSAPNLYPPIFQKSFDDFKGILLDKSKVNAPSRFCVPSYVKEVRHHLNASKASQSGINDSLSSSYNPIKVSRMESFDISKAVTSTATKKTKTRKVLSDSKLDDNQKNILNESVLFDEEIENPICDEKDKENNVVSPVKTVASPEKSFISAPRRSYNRQSLLIAQKKFIEQYAGGEADEESDAEVTKTSTKNSKSKKRVRKKPEKEDGIDSTVEISKKSIKRSKKNGLIDNLMNDWASDINSHFSEIDDIDLVIS